VTFFQHESNGIAVALNQILENIWFVFLSKMPSIEDVGTPLLNGAECECHDLEGDGYDDMLIHFSRREVILALGLDEMEIESLVPITVRGSLRSSVQFLATDCVKLVERRDKAW
jgi:hypothetical protein